MFLRRVFLLSILFGAVSWALHVRDLLPRGFAPIVSALTALFHGDGLIQSSLGAIGGVLGVDQEFDYVVAGGGTAGNVMGYRLAEAGFKVAIVEAGTFYELSKPVLATVPGLDVIFVGSSQNEAVSAADWKFSTASQQGAGGRNVHYAQGKCLGGSSAWNFMLQHRPTTGAFDKWAQTVGDDSYRLVVLFAARFKFHSFPIIANLNLILGSTSAQAGIVRAILRKDYDIQLARFD